MTTKVNVNETDNVPLWPPQSVCTHLPEVRAGVGERALRSNVAVDDARPRDLHLQEWAHTLALTIELVTDTVPSLPFRAGQAKQNCLFCCCCWLDTRTLPPLCWSMKRRLISSVLHLLFRIVSFKDSIVYQTCKSYPVNVTMKNVFMPPLPHPTPATAYSFSEPNVYNFLQRSVYNSI